jgi:hypothetical protein
VNTLDRTSSTLAQPPPSPTSEGSTREVPIISPSKSTATFWQPPAKIEHNSHSSQEMIDTPSESLLRTANKELEEKLLTLHKRLAAAKEEAKEAQSLKSELEATKEYEKKLEKELVILKQRQGV